MSLSVTTAVAFGSSSSSTTNMNLVSASVPGFGAQDSTTSTWSESAHIEVSLAQRTESVRLHGHMGMLNSG